VGVGTALLALTDSLSHHQEGNPLQNLYKRIVDDSQVLALNKNCLQKLASVADHHHRHLMKTSRKCLKKMIIVSFQSKTQEQMQNSRLMQQAVNIHNVMEADMMINDAERLLLDEEI